MERVANPGSTLGEAIGALIEKEVNRLLDPIARENKCAYIQVGRPNPRTGQPTKLLQKDAAGNEYNLDSVIVTHLPHVLLLCWVIFDGLDLTEAQTACETRAIWP